jgi:hypothetical protein
MRRRLALMIVPLALLTTLVASTALASSDPYRSSQHEFTRATVTGSCRLTGTAFTVVAAGPHEVKVHYRGMACPPSHPLVRINVALLRFAPHKGYVFDRTLLAARASRPSFTAVAAGGVLTTPCTAGVLVEGRATYFWEYGSHFWVTVPIHCPV